MARKSRKQNPFDVKVETPIIKERIYKVGGYIRLSAEDGGREASETLENQKSIVIDFIDNSSHLKLYSLYCDNGYSGTNFDRPNFQQMMEDVKSKKIDTIIVKDLSRLGRNYIETGNLLGTVFPFLGIRFISINDNYDTNSEDCSNDGYTLSLKNLIYDFYAKDISQKIGTTKKMQQRQGQHISNVPPYGYMIDPADKHHLIENKEVSHVVQKIFNMRADGVPIVQILRTLERLNISSPSKYCYEKGMFKHEKFANRKWVSSTIKRMLENQVYLGNMVQGRTEQSLFEGIKFRSIPKEDWIIVNHTHEAIIEKEIFDKVQILLKEVEIYYKRCLSKRKPSTENLLKGIIFCGVCNSRLTRIKYISKKNQVETVFYNCAHKSTYGLCTYERVNETDVFDSIISTLQFQLKELSNLQKDVIALKKTSKFKIIKTKNDKKIKEIKSRLSIIPKYKKALLEDYLSKSICEIEYTSLSTSYDTEIKDLENRLLELATTDIDNLHNTISQSPWLTKLEQFLSKDDISKEILTRELILTLVEKIVVSPSNIEITLTYKDELSVLNAQYEVIKNG